MINERIKDLIEQAGTDCGGKWMSTKFNVPILVELIVKECIEHLESSVAVPNIEHSRTKTKCIRSIKEHFGVEE